MVRKIRKKEKTNAEKKNPIAAKEWKEYKAARNKQRRLSNGKT